MSISHVNGQERLRASMALAALRNSSPTSAAPASGVSRAPDAVSISPAARALAAAQKSVAAAADIREERVSGLKAAIANGTYSIDSKTLASKIAGTLGR
jgi:flagellar biosynthesis anti-sigma factor FlgM